MYVVTIEMPRVSKKKVPVIPVIIPVVSPVVEPVQEPVEEPIQEPIQEPVQEEVVVHPHGHAKATIKDILMTHVQKVETTIQDSFMEQSVNVERAIYESARSNYTIINELIEQRLDGALNSVLVPHCEKMENEMRDIVAETHTVHTPADLHSPSFLYGFITGTVINACSFGLYLFMHSKKYERMFG